MPGALVFPRIASQPCATCWTRRRRSRRARFTPPREPEHIQWLSPASSGSPPSRLWRRQSPSTAGGQARGCAPASSLRGEAAGFPTAAEDSPQRQPAARPDPNSPGRPPHTLYVRALGRYRVSLPARRKVPRSEEHTSELQSPCNLVCRLLLEKKKKDK